MAEPVSSGRFRPKMRAGTALVDIRLSLMSPQAWAGGPMAEPCLGRFIPSGGMEVGVLGWLRLA